MRILLVIISCSIGLTNCGKLDHGVTWAPDFIKQPPPVSTSVAPDAEPNLDSLVREQASSAFSGVQSIQISDPEQSGRHWWFCARIVAKGVAGMPVQRVYIVNVVEGKIQDRWEDERKVCDAKSFRTIPIQEV